MIQVCADTRDVQTVERELRALEEVARLYPKAAPRLLTLTRDGLPAELPAGVVAQPAYKWMLATEAE